MYGLHVDPGWLATLRARAVQAPWRPRQPLWAGSSRIGSVEADFISQIYLQPRKYLRDQLLKEERSGVVGWHVGGDVTTTLNELASAMHDAGLAGAWRAEQLAATDGKGAGYVVEHIDWYRCTVPDALVPCNQDGEVEQFALMDDAPLIAAMARGAFTLEAALILAAVMGLDQAGQVQPRFVLYRSTLRAG